MAIAPSTHQAHQAQQADPTRRSRRAQRDEVLRTEVRRVWQTNHEVYGAKKVGRQLHREGLAVARCTVVRLMGDWGFRGVVRGRRSRTALPDEAATRRPAALVERNFTATRPNQLRVSDLTYVATWRGFVYVAFVIDAFAQRIVGWRASTSLRSDLAKAEVIHRRGPWRGLEEVECATLGWVAWFNWFNTCRLLEPLGHVPPAEYEAAYCRHQNAPAELAALT